LLGGIKAAHESKERDVKGMKWNVSKEDAAIHSANRVVISEGVVDAIEYVMGAGFVNGRSLVVGGASEVKNESWDAATGKK
jgi:hypothetical protein